MCENRNNNMEAEVNKPKSLGIYIHIPFCVKKCDYCDFLSAPATEIIKTKYLEALITEIRSYQGRVQNYLVSTIFIGGGTPSSVDSSYIHKIMKEIASVFEIDVPELEATIEINPGTLTRSKLEEYKASGINRLSFGLQSANNRELELLGRIHTYEQFLENYYLARELGFANINIDLMSALPGQTVASWEDTLNKVLHLNPEHISAYSLIIEEDTPFYDRYHPSSQGEVNLPDEDTDRLIYHRTKDILKGQGYHRYEISNYAKPGYECRHNSSYWIGTQYLGLGLGASSFVEGERFTNLLELNEYMTLCNQYHGKTPALANKKEPSYKEAITEDIIGLRQEKIRLTVKDCMEEFMFLGLRMSTGVLREDFYRRFGVTIEKVYGTVLCKLKQQELIVEIEDRILLTEYGVDISNQILCDFLLEE